MRCGPRLHLCSHYCSSTCPDEILHTWLLHMGHLHQTGMQIVCGCVEVLVWGGRPLKTCAHGSNQAGAKSQPSCKSLSEVTRACQDEPTRGYFWSVSKMGKLLELFQALLVNWPKCWGLFGSIKKMGPGRPRNTNKFLFVKASPELIDRQWQPLKGSSHRYTMEPSICW